jgi:phage gpG-like protein
MLRFTGEIDGITQLDRSFNRIERFISDFRSVWPNAAKEFYAIEEQQFGSEGSHGASGRWAPLSLAYGKFKAIAFPGQPILKATTSLYESMTNPDAPDAIFRMEPNELTIGTKDPKALGHQRGVAKRNLPARPIISLTNDDKRRIQKAIQVGLVRFTREAGFQVQERAA